MLQRTYLLSQAMIILALAQNVGCHASEDHGGVSETPAIPQEERPAPKPPAFTPEPGSYSQDQRIVLQSPTQGATIYYARSADELSQEKVKHATVYREPLLLAGPRNKTTLFAVAVDGDKLSAVVTATYELVYETLPPPQLSLASGLYETDQKLVLTSLPEAKIFYTLDGTTPTQQSRPYSGPLDIQGPEGSLQVSAIAVKDGMLDSPAASGTYTVSYPQVSEVTLSAPPGLYNPPLRLTMATRTPGATIHYTLDGSLPTSASPVYTTTLEFAEAASLHTIRAVAIKAGKIPSPQASATYTILGKFASPASFTDGVGVTDEARSYEVTIRNYTNEDMTWQVTRYGDVDDLREVAPEARALTSYRSAQLDRIYDAKNYDAPFAPDRVIVRFRDEQSEQFFTNQFVLRDGPKDKRALIKRFEQISRTPASANSARHKSAPMLAHLARGGRDAVLEAVAELKNDPTVEYVEPDYKISLAKEPNDPSYSKLWGMKRIGAAQAWDKHTGKRARVLVGVIDTGIDYTHPDLVDNIWTNPGEIPGNKLDDDGNGYVDDVHGYDFDEEDGDPMDLNGHGTHVSGTIAATGNNGKGVTGVTWSAQLVALKFLGKDGSGYTSDAVRALDYARTMGIRLTNNSWGGGSYSAALVDAIEGQDLFVAAAGNDAENIDASPHYPASYDLANMMVVAASDSDEKLATFSNYGAAVDLAAPGASIYSTLPNNAYASWNGTSMATPHVTGAAALIWSYNPTLSAAEVQDILNGSADPFAAFLGKVATGGRLNVANALARVPAPSWLEVIGPLSMTLAPGEEAKLTLRVQPEFMKVGEEAGRIDIDFAGAVTSTESIGVKLNVQP